jgi:hypothetical protein
LIFVIKNGGEFAQTLEYKTTPKIGFQHLFTTYWKFIIEVTPNVYRQIMKYGENYPQMEGGSLLRPAYSA